MQVQSKDIRKIRDAIGVGVTVAEDLLLIAGDPDLVIDASRVSRGLDECKARIIGERLSRIEKQLAQTMKGR